ncbi:hypothetical protein KIH07_16910 [Hydrogenophaga taeniospiralis]|uniref:DUF1566 domain-containing protein n=1 Tax=Hydrogenophaga taeniospiralis TaxID=65656 RepID=UPI001CFBB648|nr:DUF1566 domain-containing protein [Hydrogenophaga taeniospiralis]MCB4365426.1 hypothetical protein [Hydrogenophaga taeniospiralis]
MAHQTPAAGSGTTPPAPGQFWPEQNAWYAGPVAYPDGRVFALLLPADFAAVGEKAWGEYGRKIEGADSLHDGLSNTQALAAASSPAAAAVMAHGDGCYLPSRVEALQLFATLKDQIGGGWIWTSTQSSADDAWYQLFSGGLQHAYYKGCEFRAVPVRRLILQSFGTLA